MDEAAALKGSRSQTTTPEIQAEKEEIAKIEKKIEKEVLAQEYEKASKLKEKKEEVLKRIEEIKAAQQKK
jgi:hypothetical protein